MMDVDDNVRRAKSMSASTRSSTKAESEKANQQSTVSTRLGYLLARKHRIERWAFTGRNSSNNDTANTTSASLGASSAQKRSESSYSQAGRVLNIQLLQLSEQRQKLIDQNNFDQKIFANKQALKHKDNPIVLRTLSYVRKCCKYADVTDNEKEKINPAIFLDENATIKRSRSRSPSATTSPPIKRTLSANPRTQTSASIAETFLQHNQKHFESSSASPIYRRLTASRSTNYTPTTTNASVASNDDELQKRHVQFRIHNTGAQLTSQSARAPKNSRPHPVDQQIIRQVASANGLRSLNSSPDTRVSISAPLIRPDAPALELSDGPMKERSKPKRSISRIQSAKNPLQEFRRHPERFLSASNRYLPLLRRQALVAESRALNIKQQREKNETLKKTRTALSPPLSRLSTASDLTYDDAKSFLSDDNEIEKAIQAPAWLEQARKTNKKSRISSKLSLMSTTDGDDDNEHRLTLSRLRDREYAHLQDLIRSNPIEQILEPFSAIKTDEIDPIDPKERKLLDYKRLSTTSNVGQSSSTSKPTRTRRLSELVRSIDSLRCSDTVDKRARRQTDIERNRAKFGILIF